MKQASIQVLCEFILMSMYFFFFNICTLQFYAIESLELQFYDCYFIFNMYAFTTIIQSILRNKPKKKEIKENKCLRVLCPNLRNRLFLL